MQPLSVQAANLPAELRTDRRWVLWYFETRDGKPTKVPYRVDGNGKAKPNDPTTWGSVDEALAGYEADPDGGGIGYQLIGADYTVIDLDHCRNPATGAFTDDAALAVVMDVDSYTEVSPSGEGVHIIVRGTPPAGRRRRGRVEMYGPDDGRYITMTGHVLMDRTEIRAFDVAALHATLFPDAGDDHPEGRKPPHGHTPGAPASLILAKAGAAANGAKLAALLSGSTADYASHSEAQYALACVLAFYSQDADTLYEAIAGSGMPRNDDDLRKLRTHDIPNAIDGLRETYDWSSERGGMILRQPVGNAMANDDDAAPAVLRTPPIEFPFDALPVALQTLAKEGAESRGTSAESIAVHGLAVLGAAIGATAKICIGGWEQRPIIWTAAVARPGTAKSTALRLAKEPLVARDREIHERHLAAAETDTKITSDPRKTIVDGITVEKLTRDLAANPRGLLQAADELAAVVAGMNQYKNGRGSDRQIYLQLWDGGSMRFDRVTSKPIFVPEPILSVTGTIQPARADLLRGEDGMTGRWLVAFVDAPRPKPTRKPISGVEAAWGALVRDLADRNVTTTITLSPDAEALYVEYADSTIDDINAEANDGVAAYLGKIEAHLARLALVLHVADSKATVIEGETVRRAVSLCRYFAAQQKAHVHTTDATLKPWEQAIDDAVLALRDWFVRHPGKTWRDAQRAKTAGCATTDAFRVVKKRFLAVYGDLT